MNQYFKDIFNKKLVLSILVSYFVYILLLFTLYLNENNIADFLVSQGNQFGLYNEVLFVNALLGIIMNTIMFGFYIIGIWITLSVNNKFIKLFFIVLPVFITILILNQTIILYNTTSFNADNVFWIDISVRALLYLIILGLSCLVNMSKNIKS